MPCEPQASAGGPYILRHQSRSLLIQYQEAFSLTTALFRSARRSKFNRWMLWEETVQLKREHGFPLRSPACNFRFQRPA